MLLAVRSARERRNPLWSPSRQQAPCADQPLPLVAAPERPVPHPFAPDHSGASGTRRVESPLRGKLLSADPADIRGWPCPGEGSPGEPSTPAAATGRREPAV